MGKIICQRRYLTEFQPIYLKTVNFSRANFYILYLCSVTLDTLKRSALELLVQRIYHQDTSVSDVTQKRTSTSASCILV